MNDNANAYHDDYREDEVRDDWKSPIHMMIHLVVTIFLFQGIIIPLLVISVTILFVAALVIIFLHCTPLLLVVNVIAAIYFIYEVSRLHVFLIDVNILVRNIPAL